MAIDVRMPKLSDSMESGVIIRWMKAPGDAVEKGEPLAEVETDKADVELEASDSGVLSKITVAAGESATVGAVIAVLSADGDGAAEPAPAAKGEGKAAEAAPAAKGEAKPAKPAPAVTREATAAQPAPAAKREAPASKAPPAPVRRIDPPPPQSSSPVRASPLAMRSADAAGINLASVRGSGPGGRILQRDVETAARAAAPPADTAPVGADAEGGESAPAPVAGGHRVEVSRMRAAIARRMSEAKRDIPHFYVTAEIDMTEAMHLRESIRKRETMPGLTVTHLLVRALAIGLVRHPHVNASWQEGGIVVFDDVNIGIAVAVDEGLVVPVLHRAQTLTLGEIAATAGELTEKARQGRFGSDDLTGATFSLSNVGMLDVEELTAVINPPNAAILAVGAVKDRPIARDGQLAIAKTLRATLSCDHRVLNGLEGGRFLVELKSILENPVSLLLE